MVTALVAGAGCASPAAPPDSDVPASLQAVDLQATATTGVIRGLVVDEAIRPVPRANIALGEGPATETNDQGAFGFSGLKPGVHFLTVTHPQYATVRASVDVVAGVHDPNPVRVQVSLVPSAQPYVEAHERVHFVNVSWNTAAGGGLGGGPLVDVQPGSTVVQTELHWNPTTPLAQTAMVGGAAYGEDNVYIDTTGDLRLPSPAVFRLPGTNENGTTTQLRTWIFADSNALLLVGAFVNQRFDVYVHAFHNFAPDPDWQFGRDGPHPLPKT